MPLNYQALYDLIQAHDPRGLDASKLLTPQEQQEFFNFQKTLHRDGKLHESDDTLATGIAAGGAAVLPLIGRGVSSALIGTGGAMKDYDIKKPMKPLGDLLQWIGRASKPVERLANGATADELRDAGVGESSINLLKAPAVTNASKPIAQSATDTASAVKPMIKGWTADDIAEAQTLIKRGMDPNAVTKHIEAARQLKQLLGTPNTSDVLSSVATRNAGGVW